MTHISTAVSMPVMKSSVLCIVALCLGAFAARGAITITNVTDKSKYDGARSFTVVADPDAASTAATLDGASIVVGSAVNVTALGYHELVAQSRTAGGVIVDSQTIRFITRDPDRGGTEDGLPPHTPYRIVMISSAR